MLRNRIRQRKAERFDWITTTRIDQKLPSVKEAQFTMEPHGSELSRHLLSGWKVNIGQAVALPETLS
jgi:hypothetical protein